MPTILPRRPAAAPRPVSPDRGRYLLKTDGQRIHYNAPLTIREVWRLLGVEDIDVVQLKHLGAPAMVMIVDDLGLMRRPAPPVNEAATRLYLANCRPGSTGQIRGDVFVCPDDDFAEPEAA